MKTTNQSATGAGKNAFLTKTSSKSNKKNEKTVVLVSSTTPQKEEEKPQVQDAVIIEEEKKAPETITEAAPTETVPTPTEAASEQETTQVQQPKKNISIEDIIIKAERLQKLNGRRKEIKEKIKTVEDFEVGHDEENAQLTLTDINGNVIRTSNPKSIGKVLEDWKRDLYASLEAKENEILTLGGA